MFRSDLKITTLITLSICILASWMAMQGVFADPITPLGPGATTPSQPDAITGVLCTVIKALTGTIGKAVATIAIVVLGMGLFLGKLNWPLAIATAIGIGLIFGAPQVASWLGGSAATASCS